MKSYDRRYFDTWYRDPLYRVVTRADVRRRVALAVAAAEFILDRPIRNVLDVGCGEAEWRGALRRLRPNIAYTGIDASEYVVRRFGARRHIRLGTFGSLEAVAGLERFDLIVCVDVLHYLDAREIERGLAALGARLRGVAFLHALTMADGVGGDVANWKRRSAAFYRRAFERAALTSCGLSCYVGFPLASSLAALEVGGAPR